MAATQPAVHQDAATLLRTRGITVSEIIRVNADSILYLGSMRRPMTAWVTKTGTRVEVTFEPGFPAWPTPGLGPRSILTRDVAAEDPKHEQDQA